MVAEKEEKEEEEKEEEKVLTTENITTIPEPQVREDYTKLFPCEQVHALSINSFIGFTSVLQD